MRINSILFKIKIIFFISFLAIVVAAAVLFDLSRKEHFGKLHYKAQIVKENIGKPNFNQILDELNLAIVPEYEKKEILFEYKPFKKFRPRAFDIFKDIEIMPYKGVLYAHIKTDNIDILIKEHGSIFGKFSLFFIVLASLFILLFSIYILIKRNIQPIKTLEKEIIKYGNGDINIDTRTDKKDEISIVSNAFHNAVEKINNLTEARKLFMRNILHELNTPITKGKILAQLSEDSENQKLLESIFDRLDLLIKELVAIEKVTSSNYELNMKQFKIIELIDNAKDILYLEDEIPSNITNETIHVDFKLMSIVFKNLIDNGLKYGSDFHIEIKGNSLLFISTGEPLPQEFDKYLKPFNDSNNPEQGFGLGLYITNEILRKHQMKFEYNHIGNKNIFSIRYK